MDSPILGSNAGLFRTPPKWEIIDTAKIGGILLASDPGPDADGHRQRSFTWSPLPGGCCRYPGKINRLTSDPGPYADGHRQRSFTWSAEFSAD